MAFWRRQDGPSSHQVFTWLMALSVLGLFLPRGATDRVDDVFSAVVSPFSHPARNASLAVTRHLRESEPEELSDDEVRILQEDYDLLRSRFANVTEQLHYYEELNAELAGLRQRFGLARSCFIEAQVVGSDAEGWELNLNQGSLDQVEAGQLVLALSGRAGAAADRGDELVGDGLCVVGRISRTRTRSSSMQLISGPGFSLPVSIVPGVGRPESWQACGFLQGRSLKPMMVKMVNHEYSVRVGDMVLTRVGPALLPIDVMVGVVQECRLDEKSPVMWHITVAPATDLNLLQRLYVVDTHDRSH